MKDLITITDKFGVARQVELITKFNLNGYDYNYIIYRELDKSHNYIAKYQGEEIASLDTNISEEELKLAEIVFQGVKE